LVDYVKHPIVSLKSIWETGFDVRTLIQIFQEGEEVIAIRVSVAANPIHDFVIQIAMPLFDIPYALLHQSPEL
jgi:hypothetical protein